LIVAAEENYASYSLFTSALTVNVRAMKKSGGVDALQALAPHGFDMKGLEF
jgi:hypothetical protein